MSSIPERPGEDHLERVVLYALGALPKEEISVFEGHLAACPECLSEIKTLRPTVDSFSSWPTDVLRPVSLWTRLSERIAEESETGPIAQHARVLAEPDWREAAAGIFCKILAVDRESNRVTMLVRLAPGTDYPPHRHSGVEELHLLHGELMVNDKKLNAGDFIRAEAGSVDYRVWSDTGCTCLLITSTRDAIL